MNLLFKRNIEADLQNWKQSTPRKPLILRGARQVGKTSVVFQFAKEFEFFIPLNLEDARDLNIFKKHPQIDELLDYLFYFHDVPKNKRNQTLLFIDEIQAFPEAINLLRFFYERYPELAVIAAGSTLETLLNRKASYPVGRVEYMIMRPVSFSEFLLAINQEKLHKALHEFPVNPFAHQELLDWFHVYATIGGMPEIINQYRQTHDLTSLNSIYESLITSYLEDADKYASGQNQSNYLRHAIKGSLFEAGKRIKFEGFWTSNYGSREMKESLTLLEMAFLVRIVYPTVETQFPFSPSFKKSPRLQFLDTGLINYNQGTQKNLFKNSNFAKEYGGKIIEHIVGQELISTQKDILNPLLFWVRDKNGSSAKLDFLYKSEDSMIPIEVKSGSVGKLKSLLMYMEESPINLAIRLSKNSYNTESITLPSGKKFTLINLPYYLAGQIEMYWNNLSNHSNHTL